MKHISIFYFCLGLLILSSCGPKLSGDILVFSKTEGFRHESISSGIEMFQTLGEEHGTTIVTTEDATYFTEENLKNFKVVVFLNTTGDCLNDKQQYEFQRFIQAGGGFVGVHGAADTEYDWPWYNGLVGAYFSSHPNNPNVRDGSIDVVDPNHISCQHLPARWDRTDEWYNYKSIHPGIQTVLNLDETSYEGGTNGESHPIAWYHEYDGGRAFYTGGGHTHESYKEENFVKHLWGGVQYAFGDDTPVNYELATVAPAENRFSKVVFDSYLNEPMELEILPDDRILFIERRGAVKLYEPETGESRVLTTLDVFNDLEDGLLGMALDPAFEINKHVFLYYSPPGEEAYNQLSRFELHPDNEENPLQKEVKVLRVDTQRESCCHSGGSVEFGPDGNIFVSTGDNTNPFESDGFSPSDFTPGRSPFDAQKSSANTNDLRGKILRIKPQADGSYTIPEDNLFADGKDGRPEIYIMGCRNPYRFSIDAHTKYLYWGEIGPDAGKDSTKYGPRGHDEVNQAKQAGFYGWPLFIGDNKQYRKRDFAKNTTGELYDPLKPVNESPNNTGSRLLPPANEAMIYYPYAKSEEFPLVGTGGRNAMAGPIFYVNDYPDSDYRYPSYYDEKFFAYDWMRGWIMAVSFDKNGDYKSMEPFLPSMEWANLIDIVMSDEGDMYTLEYGKGWFTQNKDAQLSRLKFNKGNRAPVARFESEKTAGAAPLTTNFDASVSDDPDGDDLSYLWDFGDGSTGEGQSPSHTFEEPGVYNVTMKVVDKDNVESENQLKVYVGNEPPQVKWTMKESNEMFYWPTVPLNYEVGVSDQEDGSLGSGIKNEDVAVSIDFLEQGHDVVEIAMGHQALSELNAGHPGLVQISASDCASCHKEYGISVGPSYEKVALKYKDDKDAAAYLADKIINGGGGVWGENVMAAHPDMEKDAALEMANYILSINVTKEDNSLPPTGSFTFDKDPAEYPDGKYILTASYVDKGADGAERLRHQEVKVLRSPVINAVEATEFEDASTFTVTPDLMPGLEESFDILILNGGARIVYKDIDLTGVEAIEIAYNVVSPYMAGGDLTVSIDDDKEVIGGGELVESTQEGVPMTMRVSTGGLTAKHDLIVKAKGAVIRPVGALISMTFIPSEKKAI